MDSEHEQLSKVIYMPVYMHVLYLLHDDSSPTTLHTSVQYFHRLSTRKNSSSFVISKFSLFQFKLVIYRKINGEHVLCIICISFYHLSLAAQWNKFMKQRL